MPPYQRFEDLPVWRVAADLYDRTDDFIEHAPSRLRTSFRDQLERAALAVSNSIADGFERGTTNDLLQAAYLARGFAGEVRSMLIVAACRPYLANSKTEISDLMNLAESCCRQLQEWAESMRNPGLTRLRAAGAQPRGQLPHQRSRRTGAPELRQSAPPAAALSLQGPPN